MGEKITLKAADGFQLDGWLAKPAGTAKGGILVIQEIFGVNQHIREVTEGFAEDGYAALAPAIFDRVEPGIELGYVGDDIQRGAEIARGKLEPENTMKDLQAGIDYLGQFGKVGVVGYCFGGLMTWLCACNASGLACASGYYGGGIVNFNNLEPKVPTILHFGEKDAHIPMSDVDKIKHAHPKTNVYTYAADHGFNCDHRASYDEASAKLARSRTIEFFSKHL